MQNISARAIARLIRFNRIGRRSRNPKGHKGTPFTPVLTFAAAPDSRKEYVLHPTKGWRLR